LTEVVSSSITESLSLRISKKTFLCKILI
jgi:hypothetical protein